MSVTLSAAEVLRTHDCITPGCEGEAIRFVCGYGFCERCTNSLPLRVLRASAQRAEMRRQAILADERAAARRTDEVTARRRKRAKIMDGRTRAVLQLNRMRDQAERRGDERLVRGLSAALDTLAVELVRRKAAS